MVASPLLSVMDDIDPDWSLFLWKGVAAPHRYISPIYYILLTPRWKTA